MTFECTLTQSDILQYSLYFVKESGTVKKDICKNWLIWLVIWLIIILICFFNRNYFGTLLSAGGAVIVLVVHPFRMKDIYFDRLQREALKQIRNGGNKVRITINEDYIDIAGELSESRFKTHAATSIVEIKDYYFLTIKDSAVIIPKSKIENIGACQKRLLELARNLSIKFVTKLDWRW
jgi:hypothetical protein